MCETRHVELDLAEAFFQITVGEQTILSESGVIDQHVHLDVGARRLIQNVRRSPRLGQVGCEDQRTGAVGLLEFGRELAESVAIAGDEYQVVAFAREMRANSMPMPNEAPVIRAVLF